MQRPDISLIVGKTGSGKTVKALNLIADRKRLLIFDTLGHDYSDGVIFYDIEKLKEYWLKVYRGDFRLIYRPLNELPEFDEICRLAYQCGNLTLVAEELDIFAQPQKIELGFRQILKRGRHNDIRFIGITQRPYGIDRTITSQATAIYIFRVDEPRDIKYLCERVSEKVDAGLAMLKEYEYMECTDRSDELVIKKDPMPGVTVNQGDSTIPTSDREKRNDEVLDD